MIRQARIKVNQESRNLSPCPSGVFRPESFPSKPPRKAQENQIDGNETFVTELSALNFTNTWACSQCQPLFSTNQSSLCTCQVPYLTIITGLFMPTCQTNFYFGELNIILIISSQAIKVQFYLRSLLFIENTSPFLTD